MESESPSAGRVKHDAKKNAAPAGAAAGGEFPGVALEFQSRVRRLDGYCRQCFRDGMQWMLLARLKEQVAKLWGLSPKHVEEISRVWMQHAGRWKFRREWCYQHNGTRRKSRCVVIVPVEAATAKQSTWIARRRLVGAIQSYLRTHAVAHVDKPFCAKFAAMHGLDPIAVWYAWHTLKRVPGYRGAWKGSGEGRKFVVSAARSVSPPDFSPGISPPTSGKNKTNNEAAPRPPAGKNSGSLRSQPGEGGEMQTKGRLRLCAPLFDRPTANAPPERGAETEALKTSESTTNSGPRAACGPLRVCDRLVSGVKIGRKANFLAFAVLKNLHALHWRVAFGDGYALKFARMALRAGHTDTAIVAAYRVGLDAADRSATREWEACGVEHVWVPRCPSQVVAVAWRELAKDGRTAEARWREIFAGTTKAAKTFADVPDRALAWKVTNWRDVDPRRQTEDGGRRTENRRQETGAPKIRDEADCSRGLIRAHAAACKTPAAHASFEAALAARGLTLMQLLAQPRSAQQKFVRELFAKDSK